MEKGIRSSRDLNVWQRRIGLVKNVYKETQPFPREEIYGLTKKGKVTLEYDVDGVTKKKTCKVLSWPADSTAGTGYGEIQFTVPKGLPPGDGYTLRITNKVVSDTVPFRINP